jgi:hypothetical protein
MLLILGTVFAMTVFLYTRVLLPWNDQRRDLVYLSDVLHDSLPVVDLTPLINRSMNSSLLFYTLQLWLYAGPPDMAQLLLSLTLVMVTRSIMMVFCPLRASPDAFPLSDTTLVALNPGMAEYRHDMFFSGHVSLLVLLGMTTQAYPGWFYANACFTFCCMLLSRVHYTIDMLVSPYVTYGTVCLARAILA